MMKNDLISLLKNDFVKLKGANILIAGATGLIGCALVDLLMSIENNFKIFASGRNESRAEKLFSKYRDNSRFNFIKLDITKAIDLDFSFDFIIDLSGGTTPELFESAPVEVMESNLFGVKNLLDYGIKHNLKKFVYVSSGEIYGEGDGRIFTEDYSGYINSLGPRSCYPMAKRAGETLCVSYAKEYGVDVSIARPCHVYGPRFSESDNRVYAQFIRNVLNDENIVLKSEGKQFRSWIYTEDCASALLYILLKGENCQAYNVANKDSNLTIKELAQVIADKAGKKVVLDIPNDAVQGVTTPITKAIFSTAKLNSLGWNPSVGIEDGILKTLKGERQWRLAD